MTTSRMDRPAAASAFVARARKLAGVCLQGQERSQVRRHGSSAANLNRRMVGQRSVFAPRNARAIGPTASVVPARGPRIAVGQLLLGIALLAATGSKARAQSAPTPTLAELAAPVIEGPFVRPAPGPGSQPVWGLKDGIRIGLWPLPGPRGLLRIYAPYLDQPEHRVINFIAVEPIINQPRRSLSELEKSSRDDRPGKWFYPSNTRDAAPRPDPWNPPRGEITLDRGGSQVLSVYFHVEPFENGARPIIQARFRPDRPYEIELRTYAAPDSAEMNSCILTATMGNFARLRRLHLAEETILSQTLWPEYQPEGWGFAPHVAFPSSRLLNQNNTLIVAATSDEPDPTAAAYDPRVARHWHYVGKPATQYWKAQAADGLVARVNGRVTYWASNAPIPGGISYENFELEAPFRSGQSFIFGVAPVLPEALGFPTTADSNPK